MSKEKLAGLAGLIISSLACGVLIVMGDTLITLMASHTIFAGSVTLARILIRISLVIFGMYAGGSFCLLVGWVRVRKPVD